MKSKTIGNLKYTNTNESSSIEFNSKYKEEQTTKLRVGIFVDSFYPLIDGVTIGVNSIATILKDYVDLTIFTIAPHNNKFDDSTRPYKVIRCKSRKIPFLKIDYDWPRPSIDRGFLKKLQESNLDLVHVHSPFAVGRLGLKYAKKYKIPSVITLHSQYKQDFLYHTKSKFLAEIITRIIMRTFNNSTECWSLNDATTALLKEYGCKKTPFIMENGTAMVPVADKTQAIERVNNLHNINPNEKVLLFVGRMVELKNIFFIADVLKILKEKNFNYKMIFVGDGPDLANLKKKIELYGLNNFVIFCGRVSDRDLLAGYYTRSDLFLFPSFYDTDGVVKKEAACQGTPIICADKSIVSQTVVKDRNAFVAPLDPMLFANEIIEGLSNTEKYNSICLNAEKELYRTWEDTVRETYERYIYLLQKQKQTIRKIKKTRKLKIQSKI